MAITQTLKGAIAEYYENITILKSYSSQKQEKTYFKDLEIYFLGKSLLEITPKDIDFFQSHLLKIKKPQTVNRQFTLYNHFFSKCVEWMYLEFSPTRYSKKKREYKLPIIVWERSEVAIMLWHSRKIKRIPWLRGALRLLFLTGMRPIELSKLKKCDLFFNLEPKFKHIRIFCEKNAEGYRTIPVSAPAERLLKNLVKNKNDEDYIFLNNGGRKITTGRINQNLKRYSKRFNIKTKPTYKLRHTFATKLCRKDINIYKIKDLMGHSKIETTEQYSLVNFEDLRKVVNSK